MRPGTATGAHRGDRLGEIVCSNSFKSTRLDNASGLLKAEMNRLGCQLLEIARGCSVPAGHALGIDRELFADGVTRRVESHSHVRVTREEIHSIDVPGEVVFCTGPLTGNALARDMQRHSGDNLYFYDAIAPSLDGDSIADGTGFWASRYGKGGDDYLNIPFDRDDYRKLLETIRSADIVKSHDFEEEKYFEACLPIEVLAARGDDVLRYGPMKPRGLIDPATGREPYAVLQLRQESRSGNLLGMVGFQTRMTWPAQKHMVRSFPGMDGVRLLRYGTIHRNMFLNTPALCTRWLRDSRRTMVHYAGQICGVEGYVESIMSAMVVAFDILANRRGMPLTPIPCDTMIGALMKYVHTPNANFQPMNGNMGIMPRPTVPRRDRRQRNEGISAIALASVDAWKKENDHLFA